MFRTWVAVLAAVGLFAALAPAAGAQYTNYRQAAGDQYSSDSGGRPAVAAKACASKRRFSVRLRAGRSSLLRARVTLNGRALRVRRSRLGRTVVIDLRGRRAGTVTLRVRGVTRKGRRVRQTRRFRICAKVAKHRAIVVRARRTGATAAPAGALPGGSVVALLAIGLLGAGTLAAAGLRLGRTARRRRRS